MRPSLPALLLVAVLPLLGCSQTDVVASVPCASDADCASGRCVAGACAGAADAGRDAGRDATPPPDGAPDVPVPGFCEGSGPVVLVGDGPGRTRCGGTVAETTFRYALCTCQDYAAAFTLTTDAFDSRDSGFTPGVGGSVGTNGQLAANAPTTVGGSLWVSHPSGIVIGNDANLSVGTSLRDLGPLSGQATVTVGADAFVGDRVDVRDLSVTGTLTVPAGLPIDTTGTLTVGATVRAPVSVPAPCDCDPDKLLDVGGLVALAAFDNDNEAGGVDPGVLDGFTSETTVEIPCGRYYLPRVAGSAPLSLRITGRAAVFVQGDLSLPAGMTVEVRPGAEVDLFVSGNVVSEAPLSLGSADDPSKARLYVGGSGTVQLIAGGLFAGNLYAPRAELVTSGPIEVYGSVFVRRVAASDMLRIHYDRAVLDAGADCPMDDPTPCTSCVDCRNQACNAGVCGACASDADCCTPLVCAAGTCVPELI